MEIAYVLLFALTFFLLGLLRRVAIRAKTARTTAHCPHPNSVLGNTLEFIRNRRRFFDWYTDLLRASPSGTIEASAPPPAELIGDGLFAADGRLWSLQRKLASHAFSSRALRRFNDGVLAAHLHHRLLPFLDAAAAKGNGGVDLQDALRRFGFDAICHVAFGVVQSSSSLVQGGAKNDEALFAAFDAALEISFRRALTPATWLRRLTKLLDVSKSRRLREAVDVIDRHAFSVLDSKQAARQIRDGGDPDLLSRFMAAMDEEEDGGSDLGAMFPNPHAKRRFLRDVVVGFVLAGKDTTSSALTWFFWLLAANTRCDRRVHEEVAAAGDDVKAMHYLHAAITEAMRLYPPVPFNGRVALADDVLPSGAAVREGWHANYSAYAMGRMEEIWGKDCMEFVPERWLGAGGEFVPVDAARYPVFHAGPRVCLGKEMGYVQMKTVAAAVIRRFRVEVVSPLANMEMPPALRDDCDDENEGRAVGAACEAAGRVC
ncbi:hypothetical protein PR202_gb01182 [Eleusine coracana subsp. coracana]|uniref:Uncharacterized protein n=1 Tax=Eleusine coracana subsp. coracana TaxID=191504 RepID=A0AAV5DV98_ELECO|nr:hypothetical protein PR202_gb01182 [Eleusine coracana subsp. coracana]